MYPTLIGPEGWLTLAVSGRRPDRAFQFKQIRKRAAVTSTALLAQRYLADAKIKD
jgi:hypothetical protein